MRESTSDWLGPMLLEARGRGLYLPALMRQATVPAAEAARTTADYTASPMPGDAGAGAIHWVSFGHLLRAALGWEEYPESPELER